MKMLRFAAIAASLALGLASSPALAASASLSTDAAQALALPDVSHGSVSLAPYAPQPEAVALLRAEKPAVPTKIAASKQSITKPDGGRVYTGTVPARCLILYNLGRPVGLALDPRFRQ